MIHPQFGQIVVDQVVCRRCRIREAYRCLRQKGFGFRWKPGGDMDIGRFKIQVSAPGLSSSARRYASIAVPN